MAEKKARRKTAVEAMNDLQKEKKALEKEKEKAGLMAALKVAEMKVVNLTIKTAKALTDLAVVTESLSTSKACSRAWNCRR